MNELLGALLKRLRTDRGLTMLLLAKRVGCVESAVSRWESGGRVPDSWWVSRLTDALDLAGDDRDLLHVAAGYLPPDLDPEAVLAAFRMIRRTMA